MPTNIVIPTLGESISEGVVSAWLKPEGAYVERDEPILELETDKITMEVPAPAAGAVSYDAAEGDTVHVGAVVGAVDQNAQRPEGGDKATTPETTTTAPAVAPAVAPAGADCDAPATPLAKKLAGDLGVDLGGVRGTGPGGKVREQDVLAAQSSGRAGEDATAPATARAVTRTPMTKLRQTIAKRLVQAQHTAAMLTTFNECDMTNVMALRSRMKDQFLKDHGVKLGFMSFFIKAAVSALRKYPDVNACVVDGEKGPEVQSHGYCDVAVAVGTPKGLVVPVVRNCETLSFAGIESTIGEMAVRARDGKLGLDAMQGGTFTVSNGGVYGSMMSTPILNPPQSGILGMHNIIKRPVEHPEKPGEIALRPMMFLALSYDHRIVDGAGAVGFLKHVKECVEDPARLLLDA